jgi:hypothetical protein
MCFRSESLAVYSCISASVSARGGRDWSVNWLLRFLAVLDDVAFQERAARGIAQSAQILSFFVVLHRLPGIPALARSE